MHTLSHRDFEKRWNAATKGASRPIEVNCKGPAISLSIETILDSYETQMKVAVKAHAIDADQCRDVCEKIAALKSLTRPLDEKMRPFLKL
ncbi:MAG: hypothetical protein P1U67_04425 [Alcanivoracaceae bacterium]|nr:hypothetical protein [Alcanivoracaceae bacterium]